MALPADFSKIYGSTATGGLAPISDVNYAKGWEFVGANPPTKNDFSYLQNLSDLKSQWLYLNKLQRTNPFGDIKSDGTVPTALANLGLVSTVNLAAGAVPSTRKVNGKALTGDVDVTSQDIFSGQVITIPSGQNLNDLKTAGLYFQASNSNAIPTLNYPEASAGSLVVLKNVGGATQIYHVYNSSRIWSRSQYDTQEWTPWAREYNTQNKPSATDVGALQRTNPFGDIKSDGAVSTALANLGLGDAAKRGVGTGANQIPDMSSFLRMLGGNGYYSLPGGFIIQWGTATFSTSAAAGGSTTAVLPISYPNSHIGCVANPKRDALINDSFAVYTYPNGLQTVLITLDAATGSGTPTGLQNVFYISIGY